MNGVVCPQCGGRAMGESDVPFIVEGKNDYNKDSLQN